LRTICRGAFRLSRPYKKKRRCYKSFCSSEFRGSNNHFKLSDLEFKFLMFQMTSDVDFVCKKVAARIGILKFVVDNISI
jgi:hypothetical protein